MRSPFLLAFALGWLAATPADSGQAPSIAATPADRAAGVSINVALSWPPGAAARFDVHFGTANPPPFQCRVNRPSLALETLSAGTTYYWRVDEVASGGVTRGAVRRFTTAGKADRAAVYAWPIRIATSVRALFPTAADLGNWNYTEGMVADALYRIAGRTGRDEDVTYVREYLDRFVSPDGSLDPKAYPFELYSLDRIRPATSLLWMYERTLEDKYMKAARYVATQLDKQPRTSDGGYWHRSTYPNQMWLDGIYMADVYAVQFAAKTGQPKYYDEAVRQITLIHQHTHDPKTGLYYHGWDETKSRPWANKDTGTSPEFWGRAIGWYAMAMADVMDGLPADHAGRRTVLPIFQALCRSLPKFQDRDTGMWFQIVDKPAAPKNYVETSSTLMFAYAMARGAERGWLPAEFLEHARRATRGVLNHKVDLLPGNRMDIRGTVQVGSLGGNGGFYDYYVGVPLVTNDQKSIGAFMFLSLALSEIANPAPVPGSTLAFPIFWTWTDRQIEDRAQMTREIDDIKAAGYGGVYAMVRASRYNLFDREVTEAAVFASLLCRERGLLFIWGADPRFGATHIVRKTGHGAGLLMVNEDFQTKLSVPVGADPDTALLNEGTVAGGRYSIRYNYPARRDLHMLTEVSLWLNPVAVEKVYAYRREGGRVVRSSIRDITATHHLFANRAFNYVEVFGSVDLPTGDWRVFAFPRFDTNMYAYDSPEHEREFMGLVDTYEKAGLQLDGFWWDEPGYYFQFGHYAISGNIYEDFGRKYGYRLEDVLYALPLALDDDSQVRVRNDYFNLLMDYVYGGERRLRERGERTFGSLRMGIHQTWHWLPDDAYAGAGDLWRGLEAVDGGYTDTAGGFERYFKSGLVDRYRDAARLVIAKSLAKFSRSGRAHYNTWGVEFADEVAVYWNDLMAAFSTEWIAHCYGYTGVIGADRNFGPGFPDHSSWKLASGFNARNREILALTGFVPPAADVAIVYPTPTIFAASGARAQAIVDDVHALVGIMPAMGIQADAISPELLAEGVLDGATLRVRDQRYKAVVLPHATVMPAGAVAVVKTLIASGFPVHFANGVTSLTTAAEPVRIAGSSSRFDIPQDAEALGVAVTALRLPSPCGRLEGAYLNVIPGAAGTSFVTVMPVDPKRPISGTVACLGQTLVVKDAAALTIFKLEARPPRVSRVF